MTSPSDLMVYGVTLGYSNTVDTESGDWLVDLTPAWDSSATEMIPDF